MLKQLLMLGLSAAAIAGLAPPGWVQQKPSTVPPSPLPSGSSLITVLDARSVWHSHAVLKLPLIQFDGGLKPIETNVSWLNHDGKDLPSGWKDINFNDASWLRGAIQETCQSPLVGRLYLRGQFEVTDPTKVGPLGLTVNYRGGIVVYLNGWEFVRGHLPRGTIGPTTVGEAYPLEAYALPNGKLVPAGWQASSYPQNLALRERTLKDVAVPRVLLRKGINVLAVESIPAPYHKVVNQTGRPDFKPRDQVQSEFRLALCAPVGDDRHQRSSIGSRRRPRSDSQHQPTSRRARLEQRCPLPGLRYQHSRPLRAAPARGHHGGTQRLVFRQGPGRFVDGH